MIESSAGNMQTAGGKHAAQLERRNRTKDSPRPQVGRYPRNPWSNTVEWGATVFLSATHRDWTARAVALSPRKYNFRSDYQGRPIPGHPPSGDSFRAAGGSAPTSRHYL
jgi:hypothetical protein